MAEGSPRVTASATTRTRRRPTPTQVVTFPLGLLALAVVVIGLAGSGGSPDDPAAASPTATSTASPTTTSEVRTGPDGLVAATPTSPGASTGDSAAARSASGTPTAGAMPVPTPSVAAAAVDPALLATASVTLPRGDLPRWTQIFAEDFAVPVGRGSFPGDTYGRSFSAYDGFADTSGHGDYDPAEVLSVGDGSLDWWLHLEDGRAKVAAVVPTLPTYGQTYGRYSVRFRADPVVGYKTAFLLWPDSEKWPDDGEIDYPEGRLDGQFYGASALAQPWTGKHVSEGAQSGQTFTDWHTATTEWTPGRVEWFLDGRSIGASTTKTPSTSMHWVLQVESATSGRGPTLEQTGRVQVDWLTAYAYTP